MSLILGRQEFGNPENKNKVLSREETNNILKLG
jgi:hypothetical protein